MMQNISMQKVTSYQHTHFLNVFNDFGDLYEKEIANRALIPFLRVISTSVPFASCLSHFQSGLISFLHNDFRQKSSRIPPNVEILHFYLTAVFLTQQAVCLNQELLRVDSILVSSSLKRIKRVIYAFI